MSEYGLPFAYVPQTNKTILFAEINPEKKDLLTMLNKDINEGLIKEIDDNLTVSSFEEFLKKFEPVIYRNYYLDEETNLPIIDYSLSKKDNNSQPIYITMESAILKFLQDIIVEKKSTGKTNYEFSKGYEELINILSPEEEFNSFKKNLKDLEYLYNEYIKSPSGSQEKKSLQKKLNDKMKLLRETYRNEIFAITMQQQMEQKLLESGEPKQLKSKGANNDKKLLPAKITFDDNGNVIAETVVVNDSRFLLESSNSSEKNTSLVLAEKIAEDYEEQMKKQNKEIIPYVKSLYKEIIKVASGEIIHLTDEKISELKQSIDKNSRILEQEKQSFLDTVVPLLQNIIGIKVFFEQYKENCVDEDYKPKLLITNKNLSEFKDESARNKLDEFFKITNTVPGPNGYKNTIWFAIIPSIKNKIEEVEGEQENEDKLFNEENDNEDENIKYNGTLSNLASILQICAKYRIQTFFSIRDEKLTFANIENNYNQVIKEMEFLTKGVYSEYAIPVLPNITILPGGFEFKIGKKYEDDNENSFYKVKVPAIYMESSYLAAAIVASYQSPAYLTSKFGNNIVDKNLPGVRFNIEENENSSKISSVFSVEISGYTMDFLKYIDDKPFGFIFTSQSYVSGNSTTPTNRLRVLKARSLGKNNDTYKEIFRTTTKTYFGRILSSISTKPNITIQLLNDILEKSEYSYVSKYLKKPDYINTILKEGEEAIFNEETKQINLKLKGQPENVEIDIID